MLELNDAAVCMLVDDVPDLAGILAPFVERQGLTEKGGW